MNGCEVTPDGKSVGNDRQQVRVDDQLTQLAGRSLVDKYRKQLRETSGRFLSHRLSVGTPGEPTIKVDTEEFDFLWPGQIPSLTYPRDSFRRLENSTAELLVSLTTTFQLSVQVVYESK